MHVNLRNSTLAADCVGSVQEPTRDAEGIVQNLQITRLNRVRRLAESIHQLTNLAASLHLLETDTPLAGRAFPRRPESAHELGEKITPDP